MRRHGTLSVESGSRSRSPWGSLGRVATLLCGLGCLLAPRIAGAHILMTAPLDWLVTNSEGDPQKLTPCGADSTITYTPSNKINTVTAGQQLTVNWTETVPHDGHFRIALANSRADLTDPATVNNANGTAASAAISTAYPILADGLFEHLASSVSPGKTYTYTVTIPANMSCTKCTLQLLQFMANHPLDPSFFYHHCADMMILAAPTGAGGSAGGGGAGTSGSAGTSGAGGVNGSGIGGASGSGTGGVSGSGTGGVSGSGTGGVSGTGAGGSGVAGAGSGTGGSSGGAGTRIPIDGPASGCGCDTAGHTVGFFSLGLGVVVLLILQARRYGHFGRRSRRVRRR